MCSIWIKSIQLIIINSSVKNDPYDPHSGTVCNYTFQTAKNCIIYELNARKYDNNC